MDSYSACNEAFFLDTLERLVGGGGEAATSFELAFQGATYLHNFFLSMVTLWFGAVHWCLHGTGGGSHSPAQLKLALMLLCGALVIAL